MKKNTLFALAMFGGLACSFGDPSSSIHQSVGGSIGYGVQLYEGSILWADRNVGAARPEEAGAYFSWAEVAAKDTYSWKDYKYCKGSENSMTKYCNNSELGYNGFTDNKTRLDNEDDAAIVNWGGKWRMPTDIEWAQLLNKCSWTWTDNYKNTGAAGYIITGHGAYSANSIFLPAAGSRNNKDLEGYGSDGDYWSSSLLATGAQSEWADASGHEHVYGYQDERYVGQTIRPVRIIE